MELISAIGLSTLVKLPKRKVSKPNDLARSGWLERCVALRLIVWFMGAKPLDQPMKETYGSCRRTWGGTR